jgi:hypothetical protein
LIWGPGSPALVLPDVGGDSRVGHRVEEFASTDAVVGRPQRSEYLEQTACRRSGIVSPWVPTRLVLDDAKGGVDLRGRELGGDERSPSLYGPCALGRGDSLDLIEVCRLARTGEREAYGEEETHSVEALSVLGARVRDDRLFMRDPFCACSEVWGAYPEGEGTKQLERLPTQMRLGMPLWLTDIRFAASDPISTLPATWPN